MVKPPTKLGAFFYQDSISAVVDTMAAHGALTWRARRRRGAVIALIAAELNRSREGPPMPGPSNVDNALSALVDSDYLSPQGREWARTIRGPDDPIPPTPSVWRRLLLRFT